MVLHKVMWWGLFEKLVLVVHMSQISCTQTTTVCKNNSRLVAMGKWKYFWATNMGKNFRLGSWSFFLVSCSQPLPLSDIQSRGRVWWITTEWVVPAHTHTSISKLEKNCCNWLSGTTRAKMSDNTEQLDHRAAREFQRCHPNSLYTGRQSIDLLSSRVGLAMSTVSSQRVVLFGLHVNHCSSSESKLSEGFSESEHY